MDTAVIEFNPLPDAVRPAAQDHHFAAATDRQRGGAVIRGIVIGRVFDAADRHGFPRLHDAERNPFFPNLALRHGQNFRQVFIRETVLFGRNQQVIRRQRPAIIQQRVLAFHKLFHLLNEPRLDVRPRVQRRNVRAFAQSLIHDELPLAGRLGQQRHQFA